MKYSIQTAEQFAGQLSSAMVGGLNWGDEVPFDCEPAIMLNADGHITFGDSLYVDKEEIAVLVPLYHKHRGIETIEYQTHKAIKTAREEEWDDAKRQAVAKAWVATFAGQVLDRLHKIALDPSYSDQLSAAAAIVERNVRRDKEQLPIELPQFAGAACFALSALALALS